MSHTPVRIVPFVPELALATVRMWRRAFEQAMELPLSGGPDSQYQGQLDFLRSQLVDHELTHVLHARSPRVLGFMAQQGDEVVHLYLDASVQRQGVGSALLQQARQRSPAGLQLYTFTRNTSARAFYAAQGFTEVAFGEAAMDDNPWATAPDQLSDVQLRWQAVVPW
jgi:ribosomal protein S18 acetylase RimI-like enzyme